MAFDAGLLRHIVNELNEKLSGGRVDKIYQPARDEVVFLIRNNSSDHRLYMSAGGNGSRLHLTDIKLENPSSPPMFCMFLRKHFSGARFIHAEQQGFERVAAISFETRDDLGVVSVKKIYVELIGRLANIIITSEDDTILSSLKTVDFSLSEKRQILTGLKYELPPAQDKINPLEESFTERVFNDAALGCSLESSAEKFIISHFIGFSPLVAREAAFRASGKTDGTLEECGKRLTDVFFEILGVIKNCSGKPCIIKNENGVPVEYSFIKLTQYGADAEEYVVNDFGTLLDTFYFEKSREERIHKKTGDIFKLLHNLENRLVRKISAQNDELRACDEGEKYKLYADLITANIYRIKKGDESAYLEDYTDPDYRTLKIDLDKRLSPSGNAQKYYKKYAKTKSARIHLTEQIESAEKELEYLGTVLDSLSRAENEKELNEIKSELIHGGYISDKKKQGEKKVTNPSIVEYRTSDGHKVLCGRNNVANEHLTFKIAGSNDWWFHVKNEPGSHVVLFNNEGEDDPSETAFTEAAEIAAYNSSVKNGSSVPVDYTRVSKIKKPAGSKPGYVIYSSNWTAYVTPNADKVIKLKK